MMSYSRLRFIRNLGWNSVRLFSSKTKKRPQGSTTPGAKTSSSSLYIKREDLLNTEVLELDLGLSDRLKDVQALDAQIKLRNQENKINVYQLSSDYKVFSRITNEVEKLQKARQENIEILKPLMMDKNPEIEKKRELYMERARKLKKDIKKLKKELWPVEEKVMLKALNLPVDLHTSVPMQNEIIHKHGAKPEFSFTPKSHVELGKKSKALIFKPVSPGAYYLFGDLAHLELNLVQQISTRLEQSGFTSFSSPDMVKTHVAEACGHNFKQSGQVLTVQPYKHDVHHYMGSEALMAQDDVLNTWHKWDILLHLFGGASLPGFAAYMTRLNFATESLPVKFFSVGRKYQPVSEKPQEPSLLHTCQDTCIEMFAGAADLPQSHDLYKTMVFLMWEVAKHLPVRTRLVNIGCTNLHHTEAARTDVEVWIPGIQGYHKMCSVSMNADFISRRLMMKYSDDVNDVYNKNYIHTVHGTMLNVPVVIAALMENFQTQNGSYKLPELYTHLYSVNPYWWKMQV